MKKKILSSLAIAATIAAPVKSTAAPLIAPPPTVDPGRIQERFTGEKPEVQITDKVLIQDEQSQTDLKKAGEITFVLTSVTVEGNTVFPTADLEQFYKDKIGKTVSLADMYGVRDAITKHYREKGYILSRAVVPAQHLGKNGADFKIRIVEGYINNVSVQGEFKGDKDILDNYIGKLRKAGPLNSNDLERYLLLINDLAGTTATAVLKPAPGQGNVGATDLVIETEHKYVNGLVTFDNSGTKYIGRHLLSGEASLNSALGLSEKITVQGTISANPNELKFGDISYQMPIGYEGTKIKVLAGKTVTHPGSTLKDLDLDGRTEVFDVTVTHPFIRSRKENLTARAEFELKDTETDSFTTEIYDDRTREVTLGATYDLADNLGGVNLFDLSGSQGFYIFDASKTGEDPKSRANGNTVYSKFNFEASRLQHVYDNIGILFAAAGQYSLDPLYADEEFGIGGSNFGRGYDFSEITGDQGLAGKVELQYGIDLGNKWVNSAQLYTFYDIGQVWQRDQLPGERGKDSLSSAGFGSRFNFLNNASGFAELAKPLTRKVASENDKDWEFDFGLSYVF